MRQDNPRKSVNIDEYRGDRPSKMQNRLLMTCSTLLILVMGFSIGIVILAVAFIR
jgi:hypothetical protein